MIYTATAAQLGGAITRCFYGTGDVPLYGAQSTPPCFDSMCRVLMAIAPPNASGTGRVGSA